MTAPIPFAALPSFTPESPVRTCKRLDPFYDALWADGTEASWISKSKATRTENAGLGSLPAHLAATTSSAWERLESGVAWEQKLSVLAAIDGWRTMTSEQAAQLTGQHQIASGKHRTTGDLFAAELLEIGVFNSAMNPRARQSRGTLLRPGRAGTATDRMSGLLSNPEWVSVTAGRGFEHARQFDRHNLLATEFGLRCAEHLWLGTVLGEKLSSVTDLAYTGWGATPANAGSQQTADLTVVRADGLRIAVEITASHGKSLDVKIEKWAKILHKRSTSDSGLVVLFLVAGQPDGKSNTTAQVIRKTRQAMTHAARLHSGRPDDRTASRMMLATWEDYFPVAGHASDAFLSLRAERATGDPVNPWTSVNILNPAELTYAPTTDTQLAVLENAAGLRSTPHWLRRETPPELWQLAMTAQKFETLPRLNGPTDKGGQRAEFGAAKGVAGQAAISPRLRFAAV